jgi:hypothetical protein
LHQRLGLGLAHARQGLVEQQHLRLERHRHGQLQLATFPVGQFRHRDIGAGAQSDLLEVVPGGIDMGGDRTQRLPGTGLAGARQHPHQYVVERGEFHQHLRDLIRASQPGPGAFRHAEPAYRRAAEFDAAGVCPLLSGEQRNQG